MPNLLIEASELNWLIERAVDESTAGPLVILDCRFALHDAEAGRVAYLHSHIPGAHYCHLEADLSSPVRRHGGRHPLPKRQDLIVFLESIGVVANGISQSTIVVYDDSRFAFAARCWWLLLDLGFQDVRLLNGGYSAWKAMGLKVESEVPAIRKSDIALPDVAGLPTVDYDAVKQIVANGGSVLVDSREEKRYQGIEEPIDPVAGHIPSAINLPWQQITDDKGFIKPLSFHQHRWRKLGDEPIVVYCGSGVTACVNLLSMHFAGIDGGVLYPGSWSDWCSYL